MITLSQVASIVVPFISKILIDALTKFVKVEILPFNTLIYSAVGILLATLTSSLLKSIYDFNLFEMATKLEDKIKNKALKILQLHSLYHNSASSGQVLGRISPWRNFNLYNNI